MSMSMGNRTLRLLGVTPVPKTVVSIYRQLYRKHRAFIHFALYADLSTMQLGNPFCYRKSKSSATDFT